MKLNSHPNAPGCYEITQRAEHPRRMRSRLIQVDWDFPALATAFRWNIRSVQLPGQKCDHRGTDGTGPCPDCGIGPGVFIQSAREWLDDHHGSVAPDPGYFDGDCE